MTPILNTSLKELNSFAVTSIAPKLYFPESVEDLCNLPDFLDSPYYILGDGTNTLFTENFSPVIISPKLKGLKVTETETSYKLKIASGENWSDIVTYCVNNDIGGIENLALIPGCVGAAPVQNIGAYGVELSDVCESVDWFDLKDRTIKTLTNAQCQFAYRDSVFKNALKDKGIITSISLTLTKQWQAKVNYASLKELKATASIKEIKQKVIEVRQSKLPDPSHIPNAGSFFKNPVVSKEKLLNIQHMYPLIPNYPQEDGTFKIAAGWLIEQVGLKGYKNKKVGVHQDQALVLVNFGCESGSDIVELAVYVQQKVQNKFGVFIEPEVRLVSSKGETTL